MRTLALALLAGATALALMVAVDAVSDKAGIYVATFVIASSVAVLAGLGRRRALDAAAASGLVEARLQAVLENVGEAITVQGEDGSLVFANQAAANLLGASSPEELVATPPASLLERFHTTNEDGSPVRVEQLPGRRLLAGEPQTEPLLVRAVNRDTGAEHWRLTKATAIRDEGSRVRNVINIIEDVTEVKRAELHQRLLSEASAVLASSLDLGETLQQVAEMAVPGFADWCSVSMPGEPPFFDQVAVAHQDPAMIEFAERYRARYPPRMDTAGAGDVLATGQPMLVPEIGTELLAAAAQSEEHLELLLGLGMRSVLVVPMRAGGRTTGVISFVASESGRVFSEGDLDVAIELGRRAGVAVENSRLFTERAEVADSLQQGLLPPKLPLMPGWSAAAHYEAASEASAVGGDFYDIFRIERGWMLVVGDVAGRGPRAATLTALARYTLKTAGTLTGDPVVALDTLNRALRERDQMSLCSACLVVLTERDGRAMAEVTLAGHPPPFVVRDAGVEQVGTPGPLLGALDVESWPSEQTALGEGDQIVLYTDGVLDVPGTDDRFGEARLGASLDGSPRPVEAIERVRRAVEAFRSGLRGDDMALLAVMRGKASPTLDTQLPPGPDAARAARRVVEDELSHVLAPAALEDARLLISEVVTNAIRHPARDGPISMTIATGASTVRFEVRDHGSGFDVPPAQPDPEMPGGRGLMLVDMLAARWGVEGRDGTCVWFELDRR